MVRKLIFFFFYDDLQLKDSFIENWEYIIKSHNKNKLNEIPTLLENEALVLQSIKEMFDFEQISNGYNPNRKLITGCDTFR